LPPVRNKKIIPDEPSNPDRISKLVIDAGPRAISSLSNGKVALNFDANTPCTYLDSSGKITEIPDYPVSFPDDHFKMFNPRGPIDSLGEITIEPKTGRLIVAGGYGKASGILTDGKPPELTHAVDNDGWFDDTADGPVNATIIFDDGSTAAVDRK